MSYREISQSLEGARSSVTMFVSLWNLTDTGAKVPVEFQSDQARYKSLGFETLRDLTIKRVFLDTVQGPGFNQTHQPSQFLRLRLTHATMHCQEIISWRNVVSSLFGGRFGGCFWLFELVFEKEIYIPCTPIWSLEQQPVNCPAR